MAVSTYRRQSWQNCIHHCWFIIKILVKGKNYFLPTTTACTAPYNTIEYRFYLLNTMFNIPEACVFADLVEYIESAKQWVPSIVANEPNGSSSTPAVNGGDESGARIDLPSGVSPSNVKTSDTSQSTVIRVEDMDIYWKNLWTDVHEGIAVIYPSSLPTCVLNARTCCSYGLDTHLRSKQTRST